MIYFIEAIGAGLVKIGFTDREVPDRLRELQTASPHRLRIAATTPGGLNDESELHKRFAHLRVEGEWFRMDIEIHAAIACLGFIQPLAKQVTELKYEMEKQFEAFRNCYGIEPVFRDDSDGPLEDHEQFVFADEQMSEISNRVQRIECELGKLGWVFRSEAPVSPQLVVTNAMRRAVMSEFESSEEAVAYMRKIKGQG